MDAPAARRLPSLIFTRFAVSEDDRNPYPPKPGSSSEPSPPGPPTWFQRYWVLLSTVAGFILGAYFLQRDLTDGSVDAVPAIIYMTMMGYLPIAALGGLLKR